MWDIAGLCVGGDTRADGEDQTCSKNRPLSPDYGENGETAPSISSVIAREPSGETLNSTKGILFGGRQA